MSTSDGLPTGSEREAVDDALHGILADHENLAPLKRGNALHELRDDTAIRLRAALAGSGDQAMMDEMIDSTYADLWPDSGVALRINRLAAITMELRRLRVLASAPPEASEEPVDADWQLYRQQKAALAKALDDFRDAGADGYSVVLELEGFLAVRPEVPVPPVEPEGGERP